MLAYAWLVPVLPLVGYFFTLFVGRKAPEWLVAGTSVGLTFVSFLLSLNFVMQMGMGTNHLKTYQYPWLRLGSSTIMVGFQMNHLNVLMLFIVTLVSTLVFLFAKSYMHGDERFTIFYQYLNLFVFSMLSLVISANLLQLYIFWEMVGLCSYLLVGFWYFKPEAAQAAKKSFIVTRIGDVGLFVGIILLFLATKSFNDSTIFTAAATHTLALGWISSPHLITLAAILIFVGAVGKSAQFPLHVWLPDAMEGPTPVSALIHAATMVAAGVYLVARMFPLFEASATAMDTVAWIGGITALMASLIALTQRDIKRVIAYSTMSQLGYMMLGLGVGGYVYGLFHLMTHAFFKALLFLAAGSVIHALGTQDLFEMGGLRKKMPVTTYAFLAGALALAGIFPFAGFWSKDGILTVTLVTGHVVLYWFGLIAAFCTAFYIFRVFFLTFTGTPRDAKKHEHAHEGGWVMTVPLIVLGALATLAGFINTPWNHHWLDRFLSADYLAHPNAGVAFTPLIGASPIGVQVPDHALLMTLSVIVGLLGIGLAALMYWKTILSPARLANGLKVLYQISLRKFYWDEIYEATVVQIGKLIAKIIDMVDRYVIDGVVFLVSRLVYLIGLGLKYTQTGQVQTYGTVALLGLFVLVLIAMFRVGGVL